GRKALQQGGRLRERPATGLVQIEQAQVTPFHQLVLSLLQRLRHLIEIAVERLVERIAHNGGLPGQDRLRGVRGFAKGVPVEKEPGGEDRNVRRAGKVRFV